MAETKYSRGQLGGGGPAPPAPTMFKSYPDVPTISLDPPTTEGGEPLWDVIRRRRSVREYTDGPITMRQLSQMLWATQGITSHEHGFGLRAAPSAGARYPIETYLSAHRVEGLEPGLYHYNVREHILEQLETGTFSVRLRRAALNQHSVERAATVFVWSAIFARSASRYHDRAYRYVFLDAAHIAQNLALAAVGEGLGSCQIGAFFDDEVNGIFGLDGISESVIYMSTVGRPRRI